MAQAAAITAYDAAVAPVAHVFHPIEISKHKKRLTVFYREQVAGVPLEAQGRLYIHRDDLPSGVTRLEARVEIPVMENISGQNAAGYTAAPKVAYHDVAGAYCFVHTRSLWQGRHNVRQILVNALRGNTVSVAPETVGPVIDAFNLVVMPS